MMLDMHNVGGWNNSGLFHERLKINGTYLRGVGHTHMADNTVCHKPMRLNMKKTINTQTRSVTFTFDGYQDKDGNVVNWALAPVTLGMADVSPANATYAMLHGFAARIGDAAAIAKSAENKFTVTEAMRRAEVEAMVNFYANAKNMDWNQRVAVGPKKAAFNPAIQAIAEKMGKTYEEAMIWFNAKLMAELAAM
jgi:hypothetical protein